MSIFSKGRGRGRGGVSLWRYMTYTCCPDRPDLKTIPNIYTFPNTNTPPLTYLYEVGRGKRVGRYNPYKHWAKWCPDPRPDLQSGQKVGADHFAPREVSP